MRTVILAIDRLRIPACADLVDDYLRRARRFAPVEMREVRMQRGRGPAAAGEGG